MDQEFGNKVEGNGHFMFPLKLPQLNVSPVTVGVARATGKSDTLVKNQRL